MAKDIRTWLDHCSDRLGGRYIVTASLLSLTVFVGGLFIAWLGRFHSTYLRSTPVYLGVFGIVWVGGWIVWSSRRLARMLDEIRPAFLVTDHVFESATRPYLRRMAGIRLQLICSGALILISAFYVWFEARRGVVRFFPMAWSKYPNDLVKNLVLDLYSIPIILLICTAAIGIVSYAKMVVALSRLPINPLLSVSRTTLRPIVAYGIGTGLAWSVGLSLFTLLFWSDLTLDSIAILILLSTPAMLMILSPQYAMHVALERTRLRVLDEAYRELAAGKLYESDAGQRGIIRDLIAGGKWDVAKFIRESAEESTWIHEPADLMEFCATWLLPALPVLAKQVLPTLSKAVASP